MGYTFITDPGHGWLSVPLSDLKKYGLINEISSCSYMTTTRAYLEEDCDAPKFIKAACLGRDDIRESNNNNSAKCRGYHPYDAEYAENFTK